MPILEDNHPMIKFCQDSEISLIKWRFLCIYLQFRYLPIWILILFLFCHEWIHSIFIHCSYFRMYTRLITRIETTCSRLGKDDKFQLFICLAVHDRLLGRIVTDLTKAVAAKQVKIYTFVQKSALLTWCLVLFIFQINKNFWI